MTSISNFLRMSVVMIVSFAGIAVGAQESFMTKDSLYTPQQSAIMRVQGTVLCADCTLTEARQANPNIPALYQFTSQQGQTVIQIRSISDPQRWNHIAWPGRIWLRGNHDVIQQLSTVKNKAREVSITGSLSNSRTLDVASVTVEDCSTCHSAK